MSRRTLQIEVSVAAFILDGETSTAVGDNIVDALVGFGGRVPDRVPLGSDPEVLEALRKAMGPTMASIQIALTALGYTFIGPLDESVLTNSHPTGATSETDPVRVLVPMGTAPEGRA